MDQNLVQYIKDIIAFRLITEFREEEAEFPFFSFEDHDSTFARFVMEEELALPEVIVLLIALLPHIAPGYLHSILSEYHPDGSDFPEFGGCKGNNYRGIIPTGETALYIIGGTDIEKRVLVARIFEEDHVFHRKSIMSLGAVGPGEPKLSGKLLVDQEFIDLFLYGYITKPKLSLEFPAEHIQTELQWKDLILSSETKDRINDILVWLKYNDAVLDRLQMRAKLKPGYRVMFYGPSGVGKTLTATLLGKQTGRDVYRIDLSRIISKFVGESAKNLGNLFDKARNKNWILFFDEGDSIFGKRTGIRDAHDKYANQEVSYLLQRIETHPGLVILASNFRSNIDKAFTRRFNSIVEFENPGLDERYKLWTNNMPDKLKSRRINLKEIAKQYDLTGANIVNVVQHASLVSLQKRHTEMAPETLHEAIKREYIKEGRML